MSKLILQILKINLNYKNLFNEVLSILTKKFFDIILKHIGT
jgi:hypothetical protein